MIQKLQECKWDVFTIPSEGEEQPVDYSHSQ